jgi:cell division protein FtsL
MKSQQETKENIQKFERMQGELEELIDNITSLECKIKDQNQQIDNKDTEICDL